MTDSKTPPDTACLRDCLSRYRRIVPGLAAIAEPSGTKTQQSLIDLYDQCYPMLESALWNGNADFDGLLECYQSLFREQERLIQQRPTDDRHHFILSIPVADRPAHLRTCLESIYQLCERFSYGGITAGAYTRIRIIVAEDSRERANILRHLDLVDEYRRKGLQVLHFGQDEQYDLLQSVREQERGKLGGILTTLPRERFFLKGQAANRNLSYLKCLQLTEDRERTLYYMVDSDQSFSVNRQTESGDQIVYGLNYFYDIDKIFRTTDTLMLTGKLVGDPPVSPAVMAANFLDDVAGFFASLAEASEHEGCRFHETPARRPGDAAYHDLANLFGFENREETFPYRCRLHGDHDHAACLRDFARRLNAFFFGEHLTRKTYFRYDKGFAQTSPARTVYPGNYIVNRAGLKYVIPFGHLRLRMSGPTAGRLIAAEIGKRFASVNLPHLHRRTSDDGLDAEFRPGVEFVQQREERDIDLSNEFERQFFGDLMLFTAEQLVTEADVNQPFPEGVIAAVMDRKEQELLELYRQKHLTILEKNGWLQRVVFDCGHWWLKQSELKVALGNVAAFIGNIDRNFGDQSLAWRQIQSAEHRARRKREITDALMSYRAERDAWDRVVQ
jgi:hypothetical protein